MSNAALHKDEADRRVCCEVEEVDYKRSYDDINI